MTCVSAVVVHIFIKSDRYFLINSAMECTFRYSILYDAVPFMHAWTFAGHLVIKGLLADTRAFLWTVAIRIRHVALIGLTFFWTGRSSAPGRRFFFIWYDYFVAGVWCFIRGLWSYRLFIRGARSSRWYTSRRCSFRLFSRGACDFRCYISKSWSSRLFSRGAWNFRWLIIGLWNFRCFSDVVWRLSTSLYRRWCNHQVGSGWFFVRKWKPHLGAASRFIIGSQTLKIW